MKLSTNWLKEITPSIKIDNKLIESLTSLGLEVSSVSKTKKDTIIDLDITPNRSDCLLVYGVARDLFTIYGKTIKPPKQKRISIKKSQLPLAKINNIISPIYSCLIIENIDNKVKTPQYIKRRLNDCGIAANNIIVDAVLTDIGRQALARNDGSFNIYQFALGDDEVDYGIIQQFGRTVGKEKIEKNTPVMEALTLGSLGLKYPLVSINNEFLTHMPVLALTSKTNPIIFDRVANESVSSLVIEIESKNANGRPRGAEGGRGGPREPREDHRGGPREAEGDPRGEERSY